MDIVEPKIRSKMMASVRSKNTRPELKVRSILHNSGLRFRLHRKDLPGNPDIVLPKHKKIIFVHGCFWHQHPGCPKSKRPATRIEFWNQKLDENMKRDADNIHKLEKSGWTVFVIWECQTKSEDKLLRVIGEIFPCNYEKNE